MKAVESKNVVAREISSSHVLTFFETTEGRCGIQLVLQDRPPTPSAIETRFIGGPDAIITSESIDLHPVI